MVYLVLNSGAPVESSHWEKNHVSWLPYFSSAMARKSSSDADFPAYLEAKVRMVWSNFWSPSTQRNMCRIIAPLSVTKDWNSGENTSSLPALESGTVS